VADRVVLVGDVPFQHMADYYAAADVVVISSLMEGGNKTLSEGTLFGTPFVATESAGTIGFFDSSHGISVPVRDSAALSKALVEMLSDLEAWRHRSTACLEGRERFHSATVAAAMTQVYQRAIDLSSRSERGEAPDPSSARPGMIGKGEGPGESL
jgi:glycosyltransferase involved in cell wall biosynthesis